MADASAAKTAEQTPSEAAPPTKDIAKKPAKGKEMAIVNFLLKYIKFVGIAMAVWMMGWLGFSYVWVVCGLFVYVLWRMNQDEKKKKREAFKETAEREIEAVEARMEDLPSWVRYTQSEYHRLSEIFFGLELYRLLLIVITSLSVFCSFSPQIIFKENARRSLALPKRVCVQFLNRLMHVKDNTFSVLPRII